MIRKLRLLAMLPIMLAISSCRDEVFSGEVLLEGYVAGAVTAQCEAVQGATVRMQVYENADCSFLTQGVYASAVVLTDESGSYYLPFATLIIWGDDGHTSCVILMVQPPASSALPDTIVVGQATLRTPRTVIDTLRVDVDLLGSECVPLPS